MLKFWVKKKGHRWELEVPPPMTVFTYDNDIDHFVADIGTNELVEKIKVTYLPSNLVEEKTVRTWERVWWYEED